MRLKENRSSYHSWPIFHDQAWAPSEFFQESCTDSSVQINELHPPGKSSTPLPVPAPSQEFCITPNVSERQLFGSTFSSALNKSVWSASCIMKAQNHGDGTDCTGQHYQAEGDSGFCFSFWQPYLRGTKPKFAKGSFQLHAGADKKLVPNGNGPVWALKTYPEAMAGNTSTNTSTQEERAKEFLTSA